MKSILLSTLFSVGCLQAIAYDLIIVKELPNQTSPIVERHHNVQPNMTLYSALNNTTCLNTKITASSFAGLQLSCNLQKNRRKKKESSESYAMTCSSIFSPKLVLNLSNGSQATISFSRTIRSLRSFLYNSALFLLIVDSAFLSQAHPVDDRGLVCKGSYLAELTDKIIPNGRDLFYK